MYVDLKRLHIECARQCKSFREVLEAAHIAHGTASRIKAGKEVGPKIAGKLAAALDVDVTEILKTD